MVFLAFRILGFGGLKSYALRFREVTLPRPNMECYIATSQKCSNPYRDYRALSEVPS